MLTLGLLNRNTGSSGCQRCSVRCSSVSERHVGFSKVENFNFRSVRRPNVRHRTKFREDRSNRSGIMTDFRFSRWRLWRQCSKLWTVWSKKFLGLLLASCVEAVRVKNRTIFTVFYFDIAYSVT